jgi:hypothetical protein
MSKLFLVDFLVLILFFLWCWSWKSGRRYRWIVNFHFFLFFGIFTTSLENNNEIKKLNLIEIIQEQWLNIYQSVELKVNNKLNFDMNFYFKMEYFWFFDNFTCKRSQFIPHVCLLFYGRSSSNPIVFFRLFAIKKAPIQKYFSR